MEIVPVSEFPAATALTGAELVPIVQGGITSRSTVAAFALLAPPPSQRFTRTWFAYAGSTTLGNNVSAGNTSSGAGTISAPAVAPGTSRFAGSRRVRSTTAASANVQAANNQTGTTDGTYRAISSVANGAGFDMEMYFGWHAVTAAQRAWAGMNDAVALSSGVDPSTYTNCLMFAKDVADANLQFMYNDGSGTCTKVDTGVVFTTLIDKLLRLRIHAPAGGTTVTVELVNAETGVTIYSGVTGTTNIPAADVLLFWYTGADTAAVATAAAVDVARVSITTDVGPNL